MIGQVEFAQQRLHGRDFVGFFVDFDVRQHQPGIDGERAEHLPGLGVVEGVETALQRLAVERDDASVGARGRAIQVGGVFAKGPFDLRRAEPMQDIADGRMRGRLLPIDSERLVQLFPVDLEVGAQATIRVGAAHNCEDGKQQHVLQLVELALGAARVGNCREQRKKVFERLQGDPQVIWSPDTDSDFLDPRNPPSRLAPQFVKTCCKSDSVKSVEQPWSRIARWPLVTL